MPICPRCGKHLSSEQALTYHLNRKYKCGTWNCVTCATNFSTKFQLQIHEMKCIGERHNPRMGYQHPCTDTLLKIYQRIPAIILELDIINGCIINVSPQCKALSGVSAEQLLGTELSAGLTVLKQHSVEMSKTFTTHEMTESLQCVIIQ